MSEDPFADGKPVPPNYPIYIAGDIFWCPEPEIGMGGTYYADCGVSSEIPAAIWNEHDLLLVVNHMRAQRGADPVIPLDTHMIPAVIQVAAQHLGGIKYNHSNEQMVQQVERTLIDISDQIRSDQSVQQFWTRTAIEVVDELKRPPMGAGDMGLDCFETDIWGEFPPSDPPPLNTEDDRHD